MAFFSSGSATPRASRSHVNGRGAAALARPHHPGGRSGDTSALRPGEDGVRQRLVAPLCAFSLDSQRFLLQALCPGQQAPRRAGARGGAGTQESQCKERWRPLSC